MTLKDFIDDIQRLYNNEHLTKIEIKLPEEIAVYELRIKDFDDRDTDDSDNVLHTSIDRHYCRIIIQNWREL